jgi:hypothetical protein
MSKNRMKKPLGPTKVCPYCSYGAGIVGDIDHGVWNTRVPDPKECPRCKRYLRKKALTVILPPRIEPVDVMRYSGPPGPIIAALLNNDAREILLNQGH